MSESLAERKKLNLGCGNDYRKDCINLDVSVNSIADIVHDVEVIPWPFSQDRFQEIIAIQVLEHVSKEQFFKVMREIHRVTRKGGYIEIAVPYYASRNAFTDPKHVMYFTEETFDFFDPRKVLRENGKLYGIDFEFLVSQPYIDGNGSIHFLLEVVK